MKPSEQTTDSRPRIERARRVSAIGSASAGAVLITSLFVATGALASVTRIDSATRDASHPSCDLAPTSMVRAVLGLAVGHVQASTPFPGQVKCIYPDPASGLPVQIVFTASGRAAFQQKEKAYRAGGAPTISGIGDSAFTASISTSPGSTSDLYLHRHATELDIAAIAPLSKLESLAKKITPYL